MILGTTAEALPPFSFTAQIIPVSKYCVQLNSTATVVINQRHKTGLLVARVYNWEENILDVATKLL